ncbi:unnamed protein product [Cuscuta europaea]|uniref:Uncharacterized protein n=1 Tax=Cuscuta europaea TaxID=41803 RepID=A0A9P0Z7M5_CUSEU|nr:unnamed protein product [Cuscuta europaea]
MKELILKDSKATKLMAQLEEDLHLARAEARRLREEKAKAEEAAAEAARKAAEEAEAVRAKAVVKAREEAISGFLDGGWKAEGHKEWLSSVVEASVDEWCEGPGEEWMARKGKEYFDGGEFFTQALIYRRMDRHLNIEPKDFDPSVYGLPPLQPDVREPLPSGATRPDLEDTELMKEAEGDTVEAGVEVSSKPAAEDASGGNAAEVPEGTCT